MEVKMKKNTGLLGLIFALTLLLGGCKTTKTAGKNTTGLTGGVLEFSDDFNRKSLGRHWSSKNPDAWQIKDGRLFVSKAHNKGLWLDRLLPPKARIEFDSQAASPDVDIKCEVFNAKPQHQTGYIVILGGWHNRLSIIARLREHGKDRLATDRVGKQGKLYHWAIVRTGSTLRWYLNGDLFMEYPDKNPLKGLYFGFNDWEAPVYFDNLKIYRL